MLFLILRLSEFSFLLDWFMEKVVLDFSHLLSNLLGTGHLKFFLLISLFVQVRFDYRSYGGPSQIRNQYQKKNLRRQIPRKFFIKDIKKSRHVEEFQITISKLFPKIPSAFAFIF